MGFIVGGKGKWSAEARRESFYLNYTPSDESSEGQIVGEYLYEDYQDLLDTLKILEEYLKSPAGLRAYNGDRLKPPYGKEE
jgi:hypothetical protein